MADYLPLLRELASLDPPLFIFGGIAETVLLEHALSPSHGDVDVLIPRDELELRTEQLAELGFNGFAVYYEPRPGRPLVLGSTRGDLALELNLLDHDATGNRSSRSGPRTVRSRSRCPATCSIGRRRSSTVSRSARCPRLL